MTSRTFGRYRIVGRLGAGGMGEVYRAHDAQLDPDVALKILPPHISFDPEMRARFEREARAVAALSHPNILAIHDVGADGGTVYAVTELLEGETLRARSEDTTPKRQRPFPHARRSRSRCRSRAVLAPPTAGASSTAT